MRRIVFLLLAVSFLFSGTTPVNFSLWYPMSFNRDINDDVYFNLGVLYSHFGTLRGLSVNGGYTILEEDMYGLTVSGVGHRIKGGAKGGVIGAFSLIEGDFAGLDFNALSVTGGDFAGIRATAASITGEDFNGLALSAFNVSGGDFRGIQVGGVNISGGNLSGLEAGGFNVVGGDSKGIEVSGMTIVGESFTGVGISGLFLAGEAIDGALLAGGLISGGNFDGASLSGIFLTGGDKKGATVSAANVAGGFLQGAHASGITLAKGGARGAFAAAANIVQGDMRGVMAGAVNMTSGNFTGVKAGAVNITGGTDRGLSMGTVIVAKEQKGVPMAPVMLSKNGEIGVDYTFNNICPLNIGAKFMSNQWYAISSIGYGDTEDDVSDAIVLSGYWGRQFKLSDFRMAVDIGNVSVFNEKSLEERDIYDKRYFMLRGRLGYRLGFAELYGIVGYGGRMQKDNSDEGDEYADGWSTPEGHLYFGGGLSIHLFRPGQ